MLNYEFELKQLVRDTPEILPDDRVRIVAHINRALDEARAEGFDRSQRLTQALLTGGPNPYREKLERAEEFDRINDREAVTSCPTGVCA